MVWSHFFIKILVVNFSNSVLDNSNWDKISHSLERKSQYLEHTATLFEMKKAELQTILFSKLLHIGQIYATGKFAKKEIGKTIAQLSVWNYRIGILNIDTQLISLELKWI